MIYLLPVIAYLLASGTTGGSILNAAKKWLGVLEIGNNAGFNNVRLEKLMKAAGFVKGYNYCVWFVKAVLIQSGVNRDILKLLNGSSQTTWQNLKKSKKVRTFKNTKHAKPGDLVFYKWVNKDWSGHADIFEKHGKTGFFVISGNSPTQNGKQGIARRFRKYSTLQTGNFRLLGFARIK